MVPLQSWSYLDLALGVTGTDGYHGAAYLLPTVVHSQTPGEKTVTITILYYVLSGGTGHGKGTGHNFAPYVQVFSSVTRYSWFPSGSRGGVNFYNVIGTHGEHSKGIGIPQVTFSGE